MLITEEIQSQKEELKRLQEKYKELIDGIKNAFYEHEDYFDKTTPMKPKSETAVMSAAYCFASMKHPRTQYSFDRGFTINRAEVWKSNPKVYLDYWLVYADDFKTENGTSPIRILKKKDIKILEDTCKEAWKYAVNEKFSKSTVLGFNEWLEQTSCDIVIEILHEIYEDRIIEVTEKKLYIKDIVIIYPTKPFRNFKI